MKNGRTNGKRSNGATGTDERDAYVLKHAPTVLTAMMIRRQSTTGNAMVEEAISCVQRIWDVVHEMDVPAEAMLSQPISAHGKS